MTDVLIQPRAMMADVLIQPRAMMADVLIQPRAHKGARGWHPQVIVRHAGTLERLAEYVHSEPCLNRAVALQEAEEYARGWRLDFDRQHGDGFSEVVVQREAVN